MKTNPKHRPHGRPQTLDMSERYFADHDQGLGYVSHNNRTTWSKSSYSQPNDPEYNKRSVIGIVLICASAVALIGLIVWILTRIFF